MAIGELNWIGPKTTGTALPSTPATQKITGGEAEDIRLKFNKAANILDGKYTKTQSEWEAITVGTGDRLIPYKVRSGVIIDNNNIWEAIGQNPPVDVLSLPNITGIKPVAYSNEINFNFGNNVRTSTIQSGNIVKTLAASQPTIGQYFWTEEVIGDNTGTSTYTFPTDTVEKGDAFDSTKTNTIIYCLNNGVLIATNTVSALKDLTGPTIQSFTLDSNNAFVDITLTEPSNDSTGVAMTASNFAITGFAANGDDTTSVTIASATQVGGGALGTLETVVRLNLTLDNPSTGLATFQVTATNIEDASGNETASTSSGTITLLDDPLAAYTLQTAAALNQLTLVGDTLVSDSSGVSNYSARVLMNQFLASGNDGSIIYKVNAFNVVMAFDSVNDNSIYTNYDCGIYNQGTYRRLVNGSPTDLGITATTGDYVKLERITDNLSAYYSTDNGANWTLLHDFGTKTGNLYSKYSVNGNSSVIEEYKQLGLTTP